MTEIRRALASLPLPLRFAVACAVVCGVAGALAGLVIGLITYPPTAWAAMFELGIPSALAGALCGGAVGCASSLVRRAIGRLPH